MSQRSFKILRAQSLSRKSVPDSRPFSSRGYLQRALHTIRGHAEYRADNNLLTRAGELPRRAAVVITVAPCSYRSFALNIKTRRRSGAEFRSGTGSVDVTNGNTLPYGGLLADNAVRMNS